MKRKPTSPGEMLLEEFLKPLGMNSENFSSSLERETIDRIVRGKQHVITSRTGRSTTN